MCGRFANQLTELGPWAEILHEWPDNLQTGFNVAPTQTIPVFHSRVGIGMRWGLIPHWSKEPASKYATFNARIEGIETKPAFRDAWRKGQRCLIPALGYYEWRKEGTVKQPYFIRRKDGDPIVFGGIWDDWHQGELLSCSILTRDAEEPLAGLHPRMPIMISPDHAEAWLEAPMNKIQPLLDKPFAEALEIIQVDRAVNNVRNQGRELIESSGLL